MTIILTSKEICAILMSIILTFFLLMSVGGDILTELKRIRDKCGLSQEVIAQALGVSRSAVAMWENSNAYPRGKTLARLADLLHCTIDELYGRRKDSA